MYCMLIINSTSTQIARQQYQEIKIDMPIFYHYLQEATSDVQYDNIVVTIFNTMFALSYPDRMREAENNNYRYSLSTTIKKALSCLRNDQEGIFKLIISLKTMMKQMMKQHKILCETILKKINSLLEKTIVAIVYNNLIVNTIDVFLNYKEALTRDHCLILIIELERQYDLYFYILHKCKLIILKLKIKKEILQQNSNDYFFKILQQNSNGRFFSNMINYLICCGDLTEKQLELLSTLHINKEKALYNIMQQILKCMKIESKDDCNNKEFIKAKKQIIEQTYTKELDEDKRKDVIKKMKQIIEQIDIKELDYNKREAAIAQRPLLHYCDNENIYYTQKHGSLKTQRLNKYELKKIIQKQLIKNKKLVFFEKQCQISLLHILVHFFNQQNPSELFSIFVQLFAELAEKYNFKRDAIIEVKTESVLLNSTSYTILKDEN